MLNDDNGIAAENILLIKIAWYLRGQMLSLSTTTRKEVVVR